MTILAKGLELSLDKLARVLPGGWACNWDYSQLEPPLIVEAVRMKSDCVLQSSVPWKTGREECRLRELHMGWELLLPALPWAHSVRRREFVEQGPRGHLPLDIPEAESAELA